MDLQRLVVTGAIQPDRDRQAPAGLDLQDLGHARARRRGPSRAGRIRVDEAL